MRINQKLCLFCGQCLAECQHDAIRVSRLDGLSPKPDYYQIDAVLCQDCGACAEVCPEGAIVREETIWKIG